MNLAESTTAAVPTSGAESTPTPRPGSRKTLFGRAMHWVRRLHLYFGLLLFPWAVLYGVTAFLFNHPGAFSDAPLTTFTSAATAGTALDPLPAPGELATAVVAELNAKQKPAVPYVLTDPNAATFTRDLAFATVKTDGPPITVLVDVVNGGGTIRGAASRPDSAAKAPFATGGAARPTDRAGGAPRSASDGVVLANPLHERVKTAIPVVLEGAGFSPGEVTVTSVPDLKFPIEADGKTWTATYNPVTGNVSGTPAEEAGDSLSFRRFLLRLHLTHGYPAGWGARWSWAVIVDVMAAVMVFWGASGLLMWWQIKATRVLGFALLAFSAVVATAMGFGMHVTLTR